MNPQDNVEARGSWAFCRRPESLMTELAAISFRFAMPLAERPSTRISE
jgi:hypothetical protein